LESRKSGTNAFSRENESVSDSLIRLVPTLGLNEELKARTNHIKESPRINRSVFSAERSQCLFQTYLQHTNAISFNSSPSASSFPPFPARRFRSDTNLHTRARVCVHVDVSIFFYHILYAFVYEKCVLNIIYILKEKRSKIIRLSTGLSSVICARALPI